MLSLGGQRERALWDLVVLFESICSLYEYDLFPQDCLHQFQAWHRIDLHEILVWAYMNG